jgi:hypothetical protein
MTHRTTILQTLFLTASVLCAAILPTPARADVLYDQMTNYNPAGFIQSSWWTPDGFDSDAYAYDNFLLPSAATITEVWWVGSGGTPLGFTVRFYTGLAASPDYQPTITALPENETSADYLRGYTFAGNANQTAIPGTSVYQYHVVLPTSLSLPANTVYWIKIEADMTGGAGWGLATATQGRDGRHISYFTGLAMFLPGSASEAFQLRGTFTGGACCLSTGSCTTAATAAACAGTFQGAGTACASVSCPQPSGACCLTSGACTTAATATACAGTFQGAGTVCASVSCPQPPGACCLASGACTTAATATACAGTFQGAGTACASVSCPQPSGACCLPDGSCTTTTSATTCVGAFQGSATACATAVCPQPTGACCTGTTCSTSTLAACTGAFQGASTICGPAGNPTTCCPANFDGINGLQVADIFAFLNAWFAGDPAANFDGVPGLQVADIFSFLNAWFAGC